MWLYNRLVSTAVLLFAGVGLTLPGATSTVRTGFRARDSSGKGALAKGTIMDCLKDPELSTALKLVQIGGLSWLYSSSFPITLFAPTNDAFNLLSPSLMKHLEKGGDDLRFVFRAMSIGGKAYKENLTDDTLYSTFVSFNYLFTKFSYQLKKGIFLNEANLTGPNWCLAETGFVHLIDRVIIHGNDTISYTLSTLQKFSTLVSALGKAQVMPGLYEKQVTLLAPDNRAFEKLGTSVLDCLMAKNVPGLTSILKYHLLVGQVSFSRVLGTFPQLSTYEGVHNITVSHKNDTLMVDNATVVHPDIAASFGVIHGINMVLIPDMSDLGPCKP